jgi:hypothetical protein
MMENQQQNPTPLEKLDLCENLLDKLVDAQGRAKCGYIYIISEWLNDIKQHVLILEEQVKDNQNGREIQEIRLDLKPDNSETVSPE